MEIDKVRNVDFLLSPEVLCPAVGRESFTDDSRLFIVKTERAGKKIMRDER